MNKNITRALLAVGLAMTAVTGMAENRLYLENFSIKPGEEKAVQLCLDTEETIINCQFELILPAGLSFVDYETTERSENCPYTTSSGRVKTIEMSLADNEDVSAVDGVTPCVRIICSNMQNAPFEGTSGPIYILYFEASEDFVETSPVELRDVVCGHTASEPVINHVGMEPSKAYIKVPLANLAEYNGKEVAIDEPLGIAIVAGDKAFATDGNENWMQVRLDAAVSEEMAKITTLESGAVMGVFTDGVNPYMTAVETPVQAESEVDVIVKSYDLATDLFAPKPNEVLDVTGCYQGDKLTGYSGDNNGFGQEVSLNNDWMVGDVPTLTAKGQYKFTQCVAQLKEAWTDAASGAPARVAATDPDAASNVEIYPFVYPDVMTAVTDINTGKAVTSVKYYNAAGVAADNAFEGVNIMVTKYADGSQSVSKVVK